MWIRNRSQHKDFGADTAQLCNERGGIECDLTMTRLGEDHWYVVTGSAFGAHDMGWIRSSSPDDGSVQIRDLTSANAGRSTPGLLASVLEAHGLSTCAAGDLQRALLVAAHRTGRGATPGANRLCPLTVVAARGADG